MKFKIFKNKIIAFYVLAVALSFSFSAWLIDRHFEKETITSFKNELFRETSLLVKVLQERNIKTENTEFFDKIVKLYYSELGTRFTIIRPDGKVLGDSLVEQNKVNEIENHKNRPEVAAALLKEPLFSVRHSATLGMDMLYFALPLLDNGKVKLVVRSAKGLNYIKNSIYSLRKKILFYFLVSLFLSLLVGIYVIEKIMKPLDSVIYASKQFASGNFDYRILINSSGEIKKLSQTLNHMAQNIKDKINELNIKNNYLKTLFDNIDEAIAVINKRRKIEEANKSFEKIFSMPRSAFLNKSIFEIFDSEINQIIESVLEGGPSLSREFKSPSFNIYISVKAAPIQYIENSAEIACLLVIRDIDKLKKLEIIKRDFLSNAAHELKTPLTVIKTNLETILGGAIKDKKNLPIFLKTIEKHTLRMERIIHDIISLNYLESENIRINREPLPLKDFIERIYEDLKPNFTKKKLKFLNEIVDDIIISVDKKIFEHVFINLLDNASKFNIEEGYVKCTAEKEENKLKITIENSGVGIPAESLDRVFERFYTVDKSRSRELGGTGLGLAIAKHGVELHNGSIRAESSVGKYTRIIVTL